MKLTLGFLTLFLFCMVFVIALESNEETKQKKTGKKQITPNRKVALSRRKNHYSAALNEDTLLAEVSAESRRPIVRKTRSAKKSKHNHAEHHRRSRERFRIPEEFYQTRRGKAKSKEKSGGKSKGKGHRPYNPEVVVAPQPAVTAYYPNPQMSLRLNGGPTLNEGRVEIFDSSVERWETMCPDSSSQETANLICQELGFQRGMAEVFNNGSDYPNHYSQLPYEIQNLRRHPRCRGRERSLSGCRRVRQCSDRWSAVAVRCKLDKVGCEQGWTPFQGTCYKVTTMGTSFSGATSKCSDLGANLLSFETSQENDFITALMSVYSAQSGIDSNVWTSGHKSGNTWQWRATSQTVDFDHWFPGWPPDESDSQPVSGNGRCLALSNKFQTPFGSIDPVDYYFWKNVDCSDALLAICEKSPMTVQECYVGSGTTYRGTVAETMNGTPCKKWLNAGINPQNHPGMGLGDHNYCRNPDGDRKPWCYTDVYTGDFGYCKLDRCPDTTPASATTSGAQVGEEEECQVGDGETYRGYANSTQRGTSCISWTMSGLVNAATHPNQGLGNHNYCRNPDHSRGPWCWIAGGQYGFCTIRMCGGVSTVGFIGCREGNGESYRGNHQFTQIGTPCEPWSSSNLINAETHPDKGLGNHNYCRNPDNSRLPWCWITGGQYGYCNIPECSATTSIADVTTTTSTPTNPIVCPANQLQCPNDVCVPMSMVCDGNNDCSDGSDELNCENACGEGLYQCDSGYCIPISYVCDGEDDCDSGMDEASCTCAEDQLQCPNNLCIPNSMICDGDDDCGDGTDEQDCNVVCPANQLQCPNNVCVPMSMVCDGNNDCSDGSDELNCENACGEDLYQCDSGYCIPISYVCDGEDDCDSGMDEASCTCAEDQLQCPNNLCIPNSMICDGDDDCGDGTDEANCDTGGSCGDGLFQCTPGDCIPHAWMCDGAPDCSNGIDEENCVCGDDEFQCPNNRCIPTTMVCDGDDDCGDNMDEMGCSCPEEMFACPGSSECYPDSFICDGDMDCSDGSDETECGDSQDCQGGFLCGTLLNIAVCVPQSHVCDGMVDCYNQRDEINCTDTGQQCMPPYFLPCSVSGGCVYYDFICDGEPDCDSGEDEQGCPAGGTPTTPPSTECEPGTFWCEGSYVSGFCAPMSWRCDGEPDCKDSTDETGCDKDNYLSKFELSAGQTLIFDEPLEMPTVYVNVTPEECAEHCVEDTMFMCLSFAYDRLRHSCSLYQISAGQNSLAPSDHIDFYSLIFAEDCYSINKFTCGNGRCVEQDLVCDGKNDCGDFYDEQVCGDPDPSPVLVRLVGGDKESEGRVEVQYMGEWGVICDDEWDKDDADVVCKQLGYPGALEAHTMSAYGSGNENFLLDEVRCYGNEATIEDCSHNGWGVHDCYDYEVAGVECLTSKGCMASEFVCNKSRTCLPASKVCDGMKDCMDRSDEQSCGVQVELVGGNNNMEGRVEITRNGLRGTVCDDSFSNNDLAASVVCTMLGYGSGQYITNTYGEGTGPIWLDNVRCAGDEASIDDCEHDMWGVSNCDHSEDVAVRCLSTPATMPTSPAQEGTPGTPPSRAGCGQIVKVDAPDDGGFVARIIGGDIARYGEYPWQASALAFGDQFCGATIISERWLVSAAHCFHGKLAYKDYMSMAVGDYDLSETDKAEQVLQVEEIINHPNYDSSTVDFDVALIKVKEPGITFGDYIQPACLPTAATEYMPGLQCKISGWGSVSIEEDDRHIYGTKMEGATVPIISQEECNRLPAYKSELTDRMVCAGILEGGIDSCKGDSGGPLVCEINGEHTLLGATSWGRGCAIPNTPGIYAHIQNMLVWIEETIIDFS